MGNKTNWNPWLSDYRAVISYTFGLSEIIILCNSVCLSCIFQLELASFVQPWIFSDETGVWIQRKLFWSLSYWLQWWWSPWLSTHSGPQREAMISTFLAPSCSELCLFLWSLHWFRYYGLQIFYLLCIKHPHIHLGWTLMPCFVPCRFSSHWVSFLWWSMGAWHQLYSVATSYMTQTTSSRDTRTMNTFGLRSPCIWMSSTSSSLCSPFSELLTAELGTSLYLVSPFLGTCFFCVGKGRFWKKKKTDSYIR